MCRLKISTHPIDKNLPKIFTIEKEEWYTYEVPPDPECTLLPVNESSYSPVTDIKMEIILLSGLIQNFPVEMYIFMGHSPLLFQTSLYYFIY